MIVDSLVEISSQVSDMGLKQSKGNKLLSHIPSGPKMAPYIHWEKQIQCQPGKSKENSLALKISTRSETE